MQPNYRNFIAADDMHRMSAFFAPFLMTLNFVDQDKVPLPLDIDVDSTGLLEGALLYTRILTATTGLLNLEIVVPFINELMKNAETMNAEDLHLYVLEQLPDIGGKVMEALNFHNENIDLTTEHVREFCEINGTEFHQTPYAS